MQSYCYAVRPERELTLDVFSPAEPNGAAILLLHGGMLLVGAKEMVHHYAEPLTRQGFTVITPSYRLRPEVLWPGPLDDIKAAVAWVRDHAGELGIDPGKIVLEGFSAGAMLALLAGREPGVAAVVSFFAPAHAVFDPRHPAHLGTHLSDEETAASAPLSAIVPGYPPTMVLHGMADALIPADQALEIFARLREVGAKADLRLYQDHAHEFSGEPSMVEPIQNDVALFLKRAVVAPDRYAEESRATNLFLQPGPPPQFPEPLRA